MEEQQYSIKISIQQIYDILNHWTNLPLNGQPLPEESVRLLKEELKLLKKYLAEIEEVQKLAGLKEFIIPHEIKIIRDEPKWLEPILLEPTPLKTRPHKKSDGWRQANKNPRGLVYRY